jgi:hypothetical protein
MADALLEGEGAGLSSARIVAALPVVAACLVGAGVALSGFPPLNNAPAAWGAASKPYLALAGPACLAALVASAFGPSARSSVRGRSVEIAALALTCLGAVLSLLESRHAAQSYAILLVGLLAPAVLFVSVRRGGLPRSALAGSFLAALSVALLRADIVFFEQHGFPAPPKLYAAKFSNQPYDFHYYTLGNPDHTATFLLLPLAVGLFWSTAPAVARRTRFLTAAATIIVLGTLVLLYVRVPLLIAALMLLVAISRLHWSRRGRIAGVVGATCLICAFAVFSPHHYLTDISTSPQSSGQVRLSSITAGFRTFLDHPLTGVGLGQYGASSGVPAHSSVIEAAAEMGIAGLMGIAIMTVALAAAALRRARLHPADPLRSAALWGSAVYVVAAALTAGADDGLFVGLISIYALSLGIFAGIGLAAAPEPGGRSVWAVFGTRRWAFIASLLVALGAFGFVMRERGSAAARVSTSWSFAHGVPAGWVIRAPAKRRDHELLLRAGATANFQAYSGATDFPPGAYRYRVSARVPEGSMSIGVLDQHKQRFVAERNYSATTDSAGPRIFTGEFTIKDRALLALVLSNAAPLRRSTWALRAASITPAAEAPPPSARSLTASWSFGAGLPVRWLAYSKTTPRRGALAVAAGANHGYQLVSPTSSLPAGSYAFLLRGRIVAGGIELATLDQARQRFLVERSYFAAPGRSPMWTFVQRFRLRAPTPVSLVLSNAAPQQVSRWILTHAALTRLG